MKLIIVRHGQTIENRDGIIQGHLPGHLSELGISQAKEVSLKLKDLKFDKIYCSDLKRTKDTAKEIISYHLDTPIEYTEELREIDEGVYQGKNIKDIQHLRKHTSKDEGGETLQELFDRAKRFLFRILKIHKDDNILFISHGDTINAIRSVIENKEPNKILDIPNIDNCNYLEYNL